tara:strand:+ start:501 stop:836 length:336 start_codon:yes stop_codon:yes gene_type:complete
MQFIRDNGLYKVARITGPTHNFLAIRLSEEKCSTEVTALPVKHGDAVKLDGQKVLSQVLNGLEAVNLELGTEYFLSEVQFVPSDSESSTVYGLLIEELIKRIDANADFVVL